MRKPPATTRLSLNLAPMVDVMMCLLIFFMLAAKMVEQENSRIDLPVARAAKDAEKQALGNRLVINIRNAALHGGEGAVYLVREEVVTLAEVLRRLEAERELDPEVNCVIRADRDLAYEHVLAILVGCARAKVRNVTFGAVRTEGRSG